MTLADMIFSLIVMGLVIYVMKLMLKNTSKTYNIMREICIIITFGMIVYLTIII